MKTNKKCLAIMMIICIIISNIFFTLPTSAVGGQPYVVKSSSPAIPMNELTCIKTENLLIQTENGYISGNYLRFVSDNTLGEIVIDNANGTIEAYKSGCYKVKAIDYNGNETALYIIVKDRNDDEWIIYDSGIMQREIHPKNWIKQIASCDKNCNLTYGERYEDVGDISEKNRLDGYTPFDANGIYQSWDGKAFFLLDDDKVSGFSDYTIDVSAAFYGHEYGELFIVGRTDLGTDKKLGTDDTVYAVGTNASYRPDRVNSAGNTYRNVNTYKFTQSYTVNTIAQPEATKTTGFNGSFYSVNGSNDVVSYTNFVLKFDGNKTEFYDKNNKGENGEYVFTTDAIPLVKGTVGIGMQHYSEKNVFINVERVRVMLNDIDDTSLANLRATDIYPNINSQNLAVMKNGILNLANINVMFDGVSVLGKDVYFDNVRTAVGEVSNGQLVAFKNGEISVTANYQGKKTTFKVVITNNAEEAIKTAYFADDSITVKPDLQQASKYTAAVGQFEGSALAPNGLNITENGENVDSYKSAFLEDNTFLFEVGFIETVKICPEYIAEDEVVCTPLGATVKAIGNEIKFAYRTNLITKENYAAKQKSTAKINGKTVNILEIGALLVQNSFKKDEQDLFTVNTPDVQMCIAESLYSVEKGYSDYTVIFNGVYEEAEKDLPISSRAYVKYQEDGQIKYYYGDVIERSYNKVYGLAQPAGSYGDSLQVLKGGATPSKDSGVEYIFAQKLIVGKNNHQLQLYNDKPDYYKLGETVSFAVKPMGTYGLEYEFKDDSKAAVIKQGNFFGDVLKLSYKPSAVGFVELKIQVIDVNGRKIGTPISYYAAVGYEDNDAVSEIQLNQISQYRNITDQKIEQIKNTANTEFNYTQKIYVSADGTGGGTTANTPMGYSTFKNRYSTGSQVLPAGTVVCFKRGDVFRGAFKAKHEGVTYTAYGVGEKPRFTATSFNPKTYGIWERVEGIDNLWRYSKIIGSSRYTQDSAEVLNDIGAIVVKSGENEFDYQKWTMGMYDNSTLGFEAKSGEDFNSLADLTKEDFAFYHHFAWYDKVGLTENGNSIPEGTVYMSSSVNPNTYDAVEFNIKTNIIGDIASNCTFDNLCIAYGGAHGISGGNVKNLRVQNCEFYWIGGSIQTTTLNFGASKGYAPTRYGNGVEIWDNCDGYYVQNCYFNNIYDAAITHQYSTTDKTAQCIMRNIEITDNVMEYCNYSYEYFLTAGDYSNSYMENINYSGNHMWYAGIGLCEQRIDFDATAHIKGWGHNNYLRGYFNITDNIIALSQNPNMYDEGNNLIQSNSSVPTFSPKYEGNTYIQYANANLGKSGYAQEYMPFDSRTLWNVRTILGDSRARIVSVIQ